MLRDSSPSQGVPKLVRDTDNAQYGRDDELFYEMRVEGEVVLSVLSKTLTQNLSSTTGYA
jgi:hypothetical protein